MNEPVGLKQQIELAANENRFIIRFIICLKIRKKWSSPLIESFWREVQANEITLASGRRTIGETAGESAEGARDSWKD